MACGSRASVFNESMRYKVSCTRTKRSVISQCYAEGKVGRAMYASTNGERETKEYEEKSILTPIMMNKTGSNQSEKPQVR